MTNALAIYENFAQTKDIANALAASDLVPPHFQKKPANILIALEFAHRNNIAPFAAMQSMFVIHGRVGMNASMAISLARKHNVWKSLRYVVAGEGSTLSVTAIAKLHDDTEVDAVVSMKMAVDGGWTKNAIYKSIPEQMLKYRAATFLIRAHFPEVLFGMQTVEELHDVAAAKVVEKVYPVKPVTIDIPAPQHPVIDHAREEPRAEIIEPEAVASFQCDELETLKGDLLAYIETREDAWFECLSKKREDMVKAVKMTSTIDAIIVLQDKMVDYDNKARDILEKAKRDLRSEMKAIKNEALDV